MGGIAKLTKDDGSSLTINVEYNQLDPLLKKTINPDGDVADATGNSPFPGNMNTLVISMKSYVETLERTGGIIAEFVNPKYADSSKMKFKSTTRLECMMQDLPKELPASARVGFTMFDTWCAYSPVKNNSAVARQKFKDGNHPQSATTGETDIFAANCRILRMAGAAIQTAQKAVFNGIDVDLEALVVWSPQWASTFAMVLERLAGDASVSISQRSTLILDGNITIQNLTLDGALILKASPGSEVIIKRLRVVNEGWVLQPTSDDEEDEVARVRGFTVKRNATYQLEFKEPGLHIIEEEDVRS